ncbi:Histone-lysine N-methyltransferase SETMAR [Paragonimus heterotremus]|uniref:Histone-lysine N-methyltransferase SETMAR n=1 Tax=Paragonimus heterotremus TaxID=100268 RepID=A0A8J4WR75_9TREM|nr:Histone-lysine N-methyltransferase SETMAR [Paragonimus heterotremus]
MSVADNARPHTSIKTRETIASFVWTTLRHPPYSPDLAPSDYHLFDPMKEGLRGKQYSSDGEVKTTVKKWLKEQTQKFYEAGIHALIQRWNVAIERNGDYVEK